MTVFRYEEPPPHWKNFICNHCAASIRIYIKGAESAHIEVSGNTADDVERVVKSTIEQLRQETRELTVTQKNAKLEKADVAILVALDKELLSLLNVKGHWDRLQFDDDIRSYYKTITPSGVTIVSARSSEMGQLGAALLARDVIEKFNPSKIILTGIAAGIGEGVNLGDIVISDQIVDYEIGKVKDGNVTPRWSVYRSDGLLRDRLVEYKSSSWQSLISVPRPGHGANIGPKVHSGVVLSGNKIIADAKTAGALASIWTRALAIEMEAAGIAAALHQAVESPGFIMVKAVCDHADASKNDEWQQYASEAAAAFVISYVFEELSSHAARVIKREPALPDIISTVDLRALRFTLSKAFDLRELRILVSDLGVDWDNVAGSIKDEKIVELIWHMERRGALSRLINVVNEERPRLLSSFSPDV